MTKLLQDLRRGIQKVNRTANDPALLDPQNLWNKPTCRFDAIPQTQCLMFSKIIAKHKHSWGKERWRTTCEFQCHMGTPQSVVSCPGAIPRVLTHSGKKSLIKKLILALYTHNWQEDPPRHMVFSLREWHFWHHCLSQSLEVFVVVTLVIRYYTEISFRHIWYFLISIFLLKMSGPLILKWV